jgi:hypothetical protein
LKDIFTLFLLDYNSTFLSRFEHSNICVRDTLSRGVSPVDGMRRKIRV